QLRADSPLLGAIEGMGLARRSRPAWTNYVLRLDGFESFEDYLRGRGSNLRLDHGRRLRRLADAGRYQLEREHSGAALDWLLDNKRDWLDRTGKTGAWLSSGYAKRFFHAALLRPGAQPWSVWSILIDGERIAASLSLEERESWSPYMIVQNAAMNHLAPGRTLNLLMVERAFASGISRVEFGITNKDWKERLGAGHEAVLSEKVRIR
ncbi:MAG: GNAT family N-acetyltransferase, partial [Rubrivivax sp.]